ncbi:MAG: glycosyltransferase, partial [Opitutales bacterium]
AQGLDLTNEADILLADGEQETADAVMRLLKDSKLRKSIEEGGVQAVRQNYLWEHLGSKLNHYLKNL